MIVRQPLGRRLVPAGWRRVRGTGPGASAGRPGASARRAARRRRPPCSRAQTTPPWHWFDPGDQAEAMRHARPDPQATERPGDARRQTCPWALATGPGRHADTAAGRQTRLHPNCRLL